jgi:hypothetical protein
MINIPIEIVAFIGIVLGILGRTYFPYLKKADENRNNEDFVFQIRYIITAIISATITAILMYNTFSIPEGTPFNVFILSFVFAWGINDVTNKMV